VSAPLAAIGPTAYWYLTRGTGAAALVLLTLSIVLGILGTQRWTPSARWPRFTVDMLHRSVSLLVLDLIVIHVITTVLDGFAPISLIDAVVPLHSAYRPLWLGFGALSFDLMLAVAATSLLRRRLGYRSWQAVHWLAYASWPVAVLHGLGSGSDTKQGWMLALTAACVVAVLTAILARIGNDAPEGGLLRPATFALAIFGSLGIAIFTVTEPLQTGWAKKAGTPVKLLASKAPVAALRSTAPAPRGAPAPTSTFDATLNGNLTQKTVSGGVLIDMNLNIGGGIAGELRIRLAGAPLQGGGISLAGSQVDLIAQSFPVALDGSVTSLQGQSILATVTDNRGNKLNLQADLNIDQGTGDVTGTLQSAPA
jgi:DMSO/TMAO reductase YedYZ heme-binding membrane subunit